MDEYVRGRSRNNSGSVRALVFLFAMRSNP